MASDPIDDADASTVSLEGLANMWQDVEAIRDRVLKEKSLLVWPNPKMTGVINFNTLAMNARVLEVLLQLWCPQLSEPKTVIIDQVRDEVGWGVKKRTSSYTDGPEVRISSVLRRCHLFFSRGVKKGPLLTLVQG